VPRLLARASRNSNEISVISPPASSLLHVTTRHIWGGVAPPPQIVSTCFLRRVILSLDKIYHRSAAARLDRSLNACQTQLIRCARSLLFRAQADSFAIAGGARRENRDSGNPANPRAISTKTHARVAESASTESEATARRVEQRLP